MNVEYLDVGKIVPYEHNAKKHPEEQVRHIANSIREFGWQQPLVIDKDNVLIIGHGRLMAAQELGLDTVPVVRAENLTEEQVKALRLADNKTNESEWDFGLLNEELDGIFDIDMSDFGFDLADDEEPSEIVEVEVPDVPEEPVAKLGDVWQLGNHRLICGDSTELAVVDALMNGVLADLVVTDPPYNMNYEGAGNTRDRASKRIINDNLPEAQFEKFLQDSYEAFFYGMKDGASIYVFYKELGSGVFMRKMRDAGFTFKQELVWVKNQIVLGGSKYQSMYEPCLLGCKGETIKKWNGGRKQRSVIESIDFMGEDELRETIKELLEEADNLDVIRERKQLVNDLHPTMKPIRLLAKLINNSSVKNDIILDLFGGSGSTLIACEQLDRKCYMAEINPRYCDVIIQRWENFTGRKAERV